VHLPDSGLEWGWVLGDECRREAVIWSRALWWRVCGGGAGEDWGDGCDEMGRLCCFWFAIGSLLCLVLCCASGVRSILCRGSVRFFVGGCSGRRVGCDGDSLCLRGALKRVHAINVMRS
jgi:hypothetical protein